MKKKFLAILFILCLIFTVFPLVVFAEENGVKAGAASHRSEIYGGLAGAGIVSEKRGAQMLYGMGLGGG